MKVLFHPQTGLPLSSSGRHPNSHVVLYPIHHRRRQYARRYVLPLDPRTASQQQMRDIMRRVVPAWSTLLTPAQRRAWDAKALTVLSRWRAGQGPLSGQQLFVKLNCVWLRLGGQDLLLWPPPRAKFYRSPVAGLEVRWRARRVRVVLKVVGPVRRDLMVFGAAPCSAGWSKLRHPVYLGLIPAVAGGVKDQTGPVCGCYGLVCGAVWGAGARRAGLHSDAPAAQRLAKRPQGRQCYRSRRNGSAPASRAVSRALAENPPLSLPFAICHWLLAATPVAAVPRWAFVAWRGPLGIPLPPPSLCAHPLCCLTPLPAPVLPPWSAALEPCTRGTRHRDTLAFRLGHSALRHCPRPSPPAGPGKRRKGPCR